jgi:sugar (glycoside-pentoside-hexuronide) transporter
MSNTPEKLSVREKIGYGLGDAAANLVFQTMLIFQLSFYTDTFGLTAAAVGTLFLVVRVWDAFFDPFMGIIADRTRTRWGRFRPWILWTAVPFGLAACLAFTTPNFGATGKLIYAYVTYTVLMMVYSANNLPYSALTGVMTGDSIERTSLSSYRFVSAMLAAFVVQGLAMPLVQYFGRGDDAKGYQLTMRLFAVFCAILFLITFWTTRERVRPDPSQRSSIKQDFADLIRNVPWIVLFILTVLIFVTLALRGGVLLYYFKYYVGREDLFSAFNVAGLAASIVGILFSKMLTIRFGTKATYMVGLTLTAVFMALFFLIPPQAVALAFVMQVLVQLAYGPTIPLLWAMMADVADYSDWKNGRRATGVIYSAIVFGLKAGLGLGGAIGGWILGYHGYVANVEQSAESLHGIVLMTSIYPAIPLIIGVVCLYYYPINSEIGARMQDELIERRKHYASA